SATTRFANHPYGSGKEPDHDDPPRVPRDCRRDPGVTPAGEARRTPPARLLHPRLSGMDMAAGSRLRPVARLRRDRAARAPEEHGPDPSARALARGRPHRGVEAGAA